MACAEIKIQGVPKIYILKRHIKIKHRKHLVARSWHEAHKISNGEYTHLYLHVVNWEV